jgi:hypothetical protein
MSDPADIIFDVSVHLWDLAHYRKVVDDHNMNQRLSCSIMFSCRKCWQVEQLKRVQDAAMGMRLLNILNN